MRIPQRCLPQEDGPSAPPGASGSSRVDKVHSIGTAYGNGREGGYPHPPSYLMTMGAARMKKTKTELTREADKILGVDLEKRRAKAGYWKKWGKQNTPPRGPRK